MFQYSLLFSIIIFGVSSQYINDNCISNYNKLPGICKLINECSIFENLFRHRHIRPSMCGFQGRQPIICCPDSVNVFNPTSTFPVTPTQPQLDSTTDQRINTRNPTINTKPTTVSDSLFIPLFNTTSAPILSSTPKRNLIVKIEKPTSKTIAPPLQERISKRKCREYRTCDTDIDEVQVQVVGGVTAKPQEFPHMAIIGWPYADGEGYAWYCGGSLISERFVLTAAHCTETINPSLSSSKPTVIRLGEHNIKSNDDGASPEDINIQEILPHPEYRTASKYHDIALMKLQKSVIFSEKVKPACLWQSNNFPTRFATATGWGRTGYKSNAADVLQKVELNIINERKCKDFYKGRINRKLDKGIIREQLCAGDLDGGKDTCQGDSGGPLQIRDITYSCVQYIIGVTSFGVGCGNANSPGVYSRVNSYLDWIESVVWS